jgi:PLP dependent protein
VTLPVSEERLAELAANLADVRARITDACSAAARDPAGVHLIAVTKTFPVSDVIGLTRLGVIDIGENKDQEAAPKVADCAAAGVTVRWHFVGQLQVNKAASVATYATMIHSVDRARLVEALSRRAVAAGRTVSCLVQVNLDPAAAAGAADGSGAGASRGGTLPADVPALAAAIDAAGGLELAGVMAVAPLGQPARPAYARLRAISEMVQSAYPAAGVISAGMSGDLHDAVAEGATHVRIGTALLGGRQSFVR